MRAALESGGREEDRELRLRDPHARGIAYDADRKPLDRGRSRSPQRSRATCLAAPWSHRPLTSRLRHRRCGRKVRIPRPRPRVVCPRIDDPLPETDGSCSSKIPVTRSCRRNPVTITLAGPPRSSSRERRRLTSAQHHGIGARSGPGRDASQARRFTPWAVDSTTINTPFDLVDWSLGDYAVSVAAASAPAVARSITLLPAQRARCDSAVPTGVIAGRVTDAHARASSLRHRDRSRLPETSTFDIASAT
jgi:hypothetical protein